MDMCIQNGCPGNINKVYMFTACALEMFVEKRKAFVTVSCTEDEEFCARMCGVVLSYMSTILIAGNLIIIPAQLKVPWGGFLWGGRGVYLSTHKEEVLHSVSS